MELKDKLISAYATLEEKENLLSSKELRQRSFETFLDKGFPTKKEETWRYTPLRPLLKEDYKLFPKTELNLTEEDIAPYLIEDLDTHTLVFVDGAFAASLSQTVKGKVEVCPLSTLRENEANQALFDTYFDKIAPEVDRDRFRSINTAFSQEGSFIHVQKGAIPEKPIQLLYISTGSEKASLLQPRNLVVIEENAQVKIIERHQSLTDNPTFTNAVTEIFVAKHAFVDYYKIQLDKYTSSMVDSTFVDQTGNESVFTMHTFSLGGKITRNNVRGSQNGEHLDTTFKGLTLLNDKQHVDHNTFVHHRQPNNESHQDYKGLYDDRSHGVFDGYILVDRIAQKTDGYQKSDNILMSDRAIAHAKPQLEIYADDVLCSHGCTVGQMDKEALFYLKTRGIPEKEAKALMMYAFTSSVLSSVKIPQLKQYIDEEISKKLGVNLKFED